MHLHPISRMRLIARAVAAAVVCLVLAIPAPAGADAGPKIFPGWYLPIGVNLGAGVHTKDHSGFQIGGEVSGVYIEPKRALWAGAYADALYDFGSDSFRWSIGPEFGWSILGLDAGYMGAVENGNYHNGMVLRLVFTMSVVALYGRWGHLFGDVKESDFGEVGILIKGPVPVKVDKGYYRHTGPPSDQQPPSPANEPAPPPSEPAPGEPGVTPPV